MTDPKKGPEHLGGEALTTRFHPLRHAGHVPEALVHHNAARDGVIDRTTAVEVARPLFDALNKLQTDCLTDRHSDDLPGEMKAFQELFLRNLSGELRDRLFSSEELRTLVVLEPLICDHNVLRTKRWQPTLPIEGRLLKDATEAHRDLVKAYDALSEERSPAVDDRVVKRMANLLYVVRSNLAHGEKTPYGPDVKKRERDDAVCLAAFPLQFLLIDLLFGRPSTRLAAYGTLRPGQPNNAILGELDGEWRECEMEGELWTEGSLPAFRWAPTGKMYRAMLFESEGLPAAWPRLDEFEGPSYRRHLVTARTDHDVATVVSAFVFHGGM